jgi:hypothetical protein
VTIVSDDAGELVLARDAEQSSRRLLHRDESSGYHCRAMDAPHGIGARRPSRTP